MKSRIFVSILLAVLLTVGLPTATLAQTVGSVMVSGATLNVGTSGTVTVSMSITAQQVAGVTLTIGYNTGQVNPTSLTPASGVTLIFGNTTTNPGVPLIFGNTPSNPMVIVLVTTSLPTGSFNLLNIGFDCLGAGTSSMDIQKAVITPYPPGPSTTIQDPDARLVDGTITQTTAATPIPTPTPGGSTPTPDDGDGGGCFIATAASGNPDNDQSVQTLRSFRDNNLLNNSVGSSLVNTYYNVSPPVAGFIDDHPALKPAVRIGLLPSVGISDAANGMALPVKIGVVGMLGIISALMVLWIRRRAFSN